MVTTAGAVRPRRNRTRLMVCLDSVRGRPLPAISRNGSGRESRPTYLHTIGVTYIAQEPASAGLSYVGSPRLMRSRWSLEAAVPVTVGRTTVKVVLHPANGMMRPATYRTGRGELAES